MKYQLPEGTSIPAGGYLLILCSGNQGLIDGELHAPFSLRAYEEDVVFSDPNGKILDSYSYTRQEEDVSMARTPDGTGAFGACSQPSPGFANTSDGYNAAMAAYRLPLGMCIFRKCWAITNPPPRQPTGNITTGSSYITKAARR